MGGGHVLQQVRSPGGSGNVEQNGANSEFQMARHGAAVTTGEPSPHVFSPGRGLSGYAAANSNSISGLQTSQTVMSPFGAKKPLLPPSYKSIAQGINMGLNPPYIAAVKKRNNKAGFFSKDTNQHYI
jgi:hypothetical protein